MPFPARYLPGSAPSQAGLVSGVRTVSEVALLRNTLRLQKDKRRAVDATITGSPLSANVQANGHQLHDLKNPLTATESSHRCPPQHEN